MDRKLAGFLFLGVCVVIAALLLMQTISIVIGSAVFAIALAVLGGLSGGFRKRGRSG